MNDDINIAVSQTAPKINMSVEDIQQMSVSVNTLPQMGITMTMGIVHIEGGGAGTPGEQGPPGADGLPGKDGKDGKDGEDGHTPIKGEDYFDGQDGVDGINGADGIDATITIGTVTTGAAGTSASVSNVGTPSDAVFNFKIPKGDKGEKGDNGQDGYTPIKGEDYFDGKDGADGKDGVDGQNGTPGADGQDGDTPIKGEDYFDGADGIDGVNGTNGTDGQDGYTPIKGEDYFDGKDGADGADAFVYVAYASSNTGTDFSLTPTDSLKYRAEIHVDAEISSPQSSDFTGAVWVKYIGDDGQDGADGADATVYDGLDSESTTEALSANQGRILNSSISDITNYVTVSAVSNIYTLDINNKLIRNFRITTANTDAKTVALTNIPVSSDCEILIELTYTNAASIAWFSGITWLGSIPTFTTGKLYRILLFTSNGGTSWQGVSVGGW